MLREEVSSDIVGLAANLKGNAQGNLDAILQEKPKLDALEVIIHQKLIPMMSD